MCNEDHIIVNDSDCIKPKSKADDAKNKRGLWCAEQLEYLGWVTACKSGK